MNNFISIRVREDNLMYFFYNETEAFSVDSFAYKAILHALECEFEKINYSEEEILSLKPSIKKRKLIYALTTHNHYDHAGGNEQLFILSPETVFVSYKNIPKNIGMYGIKCIPTPCHTKCSISYLINGKYLLTGDFIFKLGCGRFFEGNSRDFIRSCENIYKNCSDSVILLYGHDYFKNNYEFAKHFMDFNMSNNYFLTLGEERRNNPFLNYRTAMRKLPGNLKFNSDWEVVEYLRKLKDQQTYGNTI